MDCEQVLEAVSAALDGELSEEEQTGLDAHLAECPACRALAEELGVLSAALNGWEADPPAGLAGDIMAAVAAEGTAKKSLSSSAPSKRSWKAWGSLAAMLALVICLSLFARTGWPVNSAAPASQADSAVSGENSGMAAYSMEPDPEYGGGEADMDDLLRSTDPGASPGHTSDAVQPQMLTPDAETPEPDAPVTAAARQITEQEALELVFEHLGGYEAYPEAEHYDEGPDYFLQLAQTERLTSYMWLSYYGLSSDETQYMFRWYENMEYTDGEPRHFTTLNWFYVPVSGGQVTAEF